MGSKRVTKSSAEYSARTVEEALDRASAELGIAVSALEYEIVRDNTRTILGFMRTGEVTLRVSWQADERQVSEAAQAPVETTAPKVEPESPKATTVRAAIALDEDEEDVASDAQRGQGNPPELEEIASEVVATVLDKMGVLAAVEVADAGGVRDAHTGEVSPLALNVVGDDLGLLIGRRGETLRNLQFIVRLIVSRRIGAWPNLVVDVEGYKAKRVVALQALAQRMADQVRQSRQSVALEPMPAHERRIVHLALRDDPNVYTESTGEDDNRKVQIIPR